MEALCKGPWHSKKLFYITSTEKSQLMNTAKTTTDELTANVHTSMCCALAWEEVSSLWDETKVVQVRRDLFDSLLNRVFLKVLNSFKF